MQIADVDSAAAKIATYIKSVKLHLMLAVLSRFESTINQKAITGGRTDQFSNILANGEFSAGCFQFWSALQPLCRYCFFDNFSFQSVDCIFIHDHEL